MPKVVIPDFRAIKIGGFTLGKTGITVKGTPPFGDYAGAIDFANRAHKAAGWWMGALIAYADERAKTDETWIDRRDDLLHDLGVSLKTAQNVKSVNKKVDPSRRREDVDFSTHAEVAALPADEQSLWLDRTATEGWTRRELRENIRASKRTKVISGQAVLEGMYRVVYADPPWLYRDAGATIDGSGGKAARHFDGMTVEALCRLPVAAHVLTDAILFLWVTATMLYEHPGPREVLEAWGFTAKSGVVWDKVLGMPGHYGFHVRHEHLIIATRGSCLPTVPTPQEDSVLTIRRGDEHSGKPEEVRKMIEKHWPTGPYLELFGRHPVPGWHVLGNDSRLWNHEASNAMVGRVAS